MPHDMTNLLDNLNTIYNSPTAFTILKEFERVLDEYDIYVYDNWKHGELLAGPKVSDYWVTCLFMWPYAEKPDCDCLKRLSSVGIKSNTGVDSILVPRKIKTPDDLRPGNSRKGKLDRKKIFIVGLKIPKELLKSVYNGKDLFKVKDDEDIQNQNPAPAAPAGGDLGMGGLGDMGAAPVAPGVV